MREYNREMLRQVQQVPDSIRRSLEASRPPYGRCSSRQRSGAHTSVEVRTPVARPPLQQEYRRW